MIIRILLLTLVIFSTLAVLYFNNYLNMIFPEKKSTITKTKEITEQETVNYVVENFEFPPDIEEVLNTYENIINKIEDTIENSAPEGEPSDEPSTEKTEDEKRKELEEKMDSVIEDTFEDVSNFFEKEWPRILSGGFALLELYSTLDTIGDAKEIFKKRFSKSLNDGVKKRSKFNASKNNFKNKMAKNFEKLKDSVKQSKAAGNTKAVARALSDIQSGVTDFVRTSLNTASRMPTKGVTRATKAIIENFPRLAGAIGGAVDVGAKAGKLAAKLTGPLSKVLNNALGSIGSIGSKMSKASKSLKLGKAVPFIGIAFAIGGGAFCFAEANSAGDLENEYKDDPESVKGQNIGCGIELAVDLLLESLELLGFFASASIGGPIGIAIAVIIAVFQLISMAFDMFDDCGYDRPLSTNKELEDLRIDFLYSFMKELEDMLVKATDDLYNNFVVKALEECNNLIKYNVDSSRESDEFYKILKDDYDCEKDEWGEKDLVKDGNAVDITTAYYDIIEKVKANLASTTPEYDYMSKEEFENILENEDKQREILGTSLYDILGYDLKTFISNSIRDFITTMKYPKPQEFREGNAFESYLTKNDYDKFNKYKLDYYAICDLIPNPIDPAKIYQEQREAAERKRRYVYLNKTILETTIIMQETQDQQILALDRISEFTGLAATLFTDILTEIDSQKTYIYEFRKQFEDNQKAKEAIENLYSNQLQDIFSNITIYNIDNIDINTLLSSLDLDEESKNDIILSFEEIKQEKTEMKEFMVSQLIDFIKMRQIINKELEEAGKKTKTNTKIITYEEIDKQLEQYKQYSFYGFVALICTYLAYETYNIIKK